MSLYLKYRPKTLSEIIGNEQTVNSLDKMLSNLKTCPHSFLLTGPTGCGKTTVGRIIAERLGCSGDDFKEVDSADFRGIDTIRNIRSQSQYSPIESSCRVWLIDECHKLTNDAQNALLKILEDTPRHIYFILATTDPQKLLKTVKGRCSTFDMRLLSDKEMMILLRTVVKGQDESMDKIIYEQIINDCQGHPRNALQILEQVLNVEGEERLEIAKRSAENVSQSIALCRLLLKENVSWKSIADVLKGLKDEDPEGIRRHVLGYCQSVLLNSQNDRAGLIMEEFIEPFYNTGMPGLVFACYTVIRN